MEPKLSSAPSMKFPIFIYFGGFEEYLRLGEELNIELRDFF